MNDILVPLLNLLPAMWGKRWWGLAVAWAVGIVGGVGLLHFKNRYEASATMYVDTQSTLRPLLQGLSVPPELGAQVHMLANTMLSRANLETVIERNHLLPPNASAHDRAEMVQSLGSAIKLDFSQSNSIYKIKFISHNPDQTLGVVRTLVDLFIQEGLAGNAQQSNQALEFIDSQITLYKAKLLTAEDNLRKFRIAHPNFSPPGGSDLAARQAQLQDQLFGLQGQLAAAESSRSALQAQLAEVPPTISPELVGAPGGGQSVESGPLDQRIAVEQARLDSLLQRYTDAYPDVIAARRTLAQLEAQRRRQQRERASAPATSTHYSLGTNPVYQQLRISLAQSSANVASLQGRIADVQQHIKVLEGRERLRPALDDQYLELTRDYNVLNESYQKLVQRRETALLSRNQSNSQRKDFFRIVDPPRLSPVALFPRRNMLIAVVLVLALVAGTATSLGLSVLLPSFHTARQLRESTGHVVLGAVSLVPTPALRTRARRSAGVFYTASAILVLTYVAWGLAGTLHLIH